MRAEGRPALMPAWSGAALVALTKLAVIAAVLARGFEAVSDDDYARVVIAEEWARAPRLDPSGTSWLPLPFWITGVAMRVLGRSLFVARATAVALGVASALLVYAAAARFWASNRSALHARAPLAGALVAAVFPWSARLGAATVPELPAAALGLFALSVSRRDASVRARLAGAAALGAACLSRYDFWPLAAAFALLVLLDAAHASTARVRVLTAAAAPLALAGPIAWIAWNQSAHGHALHFLARVSAYSRAVGAGGETSLFARLVAYPSAMLRAEPEVFALLAAALVTLGLVDRAALARALAPLRRPVALVCVQLVALALAMVRDGAPTHHPERAMLLGLLLMAVVGGGLAAEALERLVPARRGSARRRYLVVVAPVALLAAATEMLRPFVEPSFALRTDERAIGEALAKSLPAGRRALLEVADYGYFAVLAACGRPEDVVLDRSIDPRGPVKPSSFLAEGALARRLDEVAPDVVVARPSPEIERALGGPPSVVRGAWALWGARPSRPAR